jgi:epoxyqueuosine reductase
MVLGAGFIRVRIIAPFTPGGSSHSPIPEPYQRGAASLLVAALPYGNLSEVEAVPAFEPTAYIAPFARRNYYREGVKRLQRLAAEFRSHYGGTRSDFRILCNSPIPEKPLALASGLGFLGRNSLIITPEAGSLIILAAMTLPFTLEGDRPEEIAKEKPFPLCGSCDFLCPPCAAACPTNAIRGDGTINQTRCIQWYASGKGDTVPPEIARKWGNRLYGCTECQDACIYNHRYIQGVFSDEGPIPAYLNPLELYGLGDEELKARFKGTCMGLSWLGPKGIRRNIQMILKK